LDPAKERCEKDHGVDGCEKSGLIYYPKCKEGYHAFGCCICIKDDAPPPPPEEAGIPETEAEPVAGEGEEEEGEHPDEGEKDGEEEEGEHPDEGEKDGEEEDGNLLDGPDESEKDGEEENDNEPPLFSEDGEPLLRTPDGVKTNDGKGIPPSDFYDKDGNHIAGNGKPYVELFNKDGNPIPIDEDGIPIKDNIKEIDNPPYFNKDGIQLPEESYKDFILPEEFEVMTGSSPITDEPVTGEEDSSETGETGEE